MTRVFIDNREIEPAIAGMPLDQGLKNIEAAHIGEDSVIREVLINGEALTPETLTSRTIRNSMERMPGNGRIDVFTGDRDEIANGAIAEALACLDRIERVSPCIAESFIESPTRGALEDLHQLCEGFYWTTVLLDKLEAGYQIRPARPEAREKAHRLLENIHAARSRGDFLHLARLLEHGLAPLLPFFRESLNAVSGKANAVH